MNTLDVRFFYIAFWLYFAGFAFFSLYVPFRKDAVQRVATTLMALGLIPQTIAIIIRWMTSEHVPLSNMYEYMSLMSWMAVVVMLVLIWRYRKPLVGVFISAMVFMLMVTASLLPKDVSQALVPALQSYWITIHVTLAALGSGAFVVACAVSFLYLMKVYRRDVSTDLPGKALLWWGLSFIIFPIILHLALLLFGVHLPSSAAINIGTSSLTGWGGFLISLGMGLPLGALIFSWVFRHQLRKGDESHFGSNLFAVSVFTLLLSALLAGLANAGGILTLTSRSVLRIFEFFGATMLIAWLLFYPCYFLLNRLNKTLLSKMELNLDLLDEINYKAITLGYPLYTVGALFAGAIWAEQAWGSFWSWDPKEVGSMIIWLFYTGFLHARYQRQWKGSKAAMLAVFGFLMVLLSFFGNYFFGGQHSYT